MEKLDFNLENCYGIKKLKGNFDFLENNTYSIYAPNGVMKTSFAKTFKDISNGVDSKDLIFPNRITIRNIKDQNNVDLTQEEVFVIESYDENYNSEKLSTLLVNKKLKEQYDSIYIEISKRKEELIKKLADLSGLKKNTEKEILEIFTNKNDNIFNSLASVEKKVLDNTENNFVDISYAEIFSVRTIQFLETKDIKSKITEYIKKYDELISSSSYFKKGIFNHNNAAIISKSLADNGFFKAQHSILLNREEEKKEVQTQGELNKLIEDEINRILDDPDLLKIFNQIDGKLKANKELRDFREYLSNNIKILPELEDISNFKEKIWFSYLNDQIDLYNNFLEEYKKGKKELENIIIQAKTEETRWKKVVDDFNKRFFVPFQIKIENQEDVILKSGIPSISFTFKDNENEVPVEKYNLLQVLSSGEKKALYILNIIFEIQARKENDQKTLFVIDDIADSFDYKNKYAIIEYLKEISEESNFYQIILTHNFDFFRIIQSRLSIPRNSCCLMVEKNKNEVRLVKAEYLKPFNYWIKNLDDDKKLIASIPFVRNIIEYTNGNKDDDYVKLTSLLHIKNDSELITKQDIEEIYKKIFPDLSTLNLTLKNDKIIDLIFSLADTSLTDPEGINLENKILFAIAIRLKAEKFMISKITNKDEPNSSQTREFFDRFKNEFEISDPKNIELLNRVNLMTPENIHLNSFMYEPILDMSDESLRGLYKDISNLVKN